MKRKKGRDVYRCEERARRRYGNGDGAADASSVVGCGDSVRSSMLGLGCSSMILGGPSCTGVKLLLVPSDLAVTGLPNSVVSDGRRDSNSDLGDGVPLACIIDARVNDDAGGMASGPGAPRRDADPLRD